MTRYIDMMLQLGLRQMAGRQLTLIVVNRRFGVNITPLDCASSVKGPMLECFRL